MVQTERTHGGKREVSSASLAAAASFALALVATPPLQAQSPLPAEGYGHIHATLWTMVAACIFQQPNFEQSLVFNMIDDAQRIDMGGGLTVFRDSPSLGRSELHIQSVVDGQGYCLGFSPDATLADAGAFMATYMSSDDSATMLFREVDAPGGGRAWEHRFSDYPVRIESVLVEGSGAGLRVSVSGVSEEQLTLLAGSIPHVPRHLPGYPEVNMQYFEQLFQFYCGYHRMDPDAILANARRSGGTVTPSGSGSVAQWDHVPYYVYVQALTETQPFQCAAAAPGFTVEEMRTPARAAFAEAEPQSDPNGPPGSLMFSFPEYVTEEGVSFEPRPGVTTRGRTFAIEGGAGLMLEARYDQDRDAQSPMATAFIAFNTFCPRTDLRTDALIERLREIGTPVRGVEPPYDILVERTTRPNLHDGEPGLAVRRCEIWVPGDRANEVVAMLSLTDANVWSFGATVALPRGVSGTSDARFIGAFESMDPRTFLVEVGVRDAGGTPETYMRADLLTPEDAQ